MNSEAVIRTTRGQGRKVTSGSGSLNAPRGNAVCIIGMHRSGTSVASRLVNLLGYSLGPTNRLVEADVWNREGYWEHGDMTSLNEEILNSYAGSWYEPPTREALTAEPPSELAEKARGILNRDFSGQARWAWKDPRTTLTLPFWRRLLPDLSFVICVRNPLDVCSSLVERDGREFKKAEQLCLRYMLDAIENTAGQRRLFLLYEECIAEPHGRLRRLASFLGVDDEQLVAAAEVEAARFLQPELRHHHASMERLLAAPLHPYLKSLYLAIWAKQSAPEVVSEESLDTFARRLYWSLGEAADLQHRLARAEDALNTRTIELQQALHSVEQAESDRARSELETAAKAVELVRLRADLQESKSRLERVEAERTYTSSHLDQARKQLRAAEAEVEEISSQLKAAELVATVRTRAAAEAQAAASALRLQLDIIHRSFSYRLVGKPFRLAYDLLHWRDRRTRSWASKAPGRDDDGAPVAPGLPLMEQAARAGHSLELVSPDTFIGYLDAPPVDERHGRLPCEVAGWVVPGSGLIDRVEVLVDGELAGRARLGMPRPDLVGPFEQPVAPVSGFQFVLDLCDVPSETSHLYLSFTAYGVSGYSQAFPARIIRLRTGEIRSVEPETPPPDAQRSDLTKGKLKLACFTHDLGYGGGQLYLFELLKKMAGQDNFSAAIVSPADGPLRRDLQAMGFDVEIIPWPSTGDLRRYEEELDGLVAWIQKRGFNVVFANTLIGFSAIEAATRAGVPNIWAVHESYPLAVWCAMYNGWLEQPSHQMLGQLEKSFRRASMIVFEAEATREMFLKHGDPDRLVKVSYGIDTMGINDYLSSYDRQEARSLAGIGQDSRVILCVATIEPRKQQTVLAQAFSLVAQKHEDAHLILVGDLPGDYSASLRDFISRSGLDDRVTIFPVVPDAYRWYGLADVFALVSDIESLPRSVMESMCFGVPVLSSNVFGTSELIRDGINGFLVEANSIRAIADALDQILSMDRDELAAIGAAGRQTILESYDSSHYAATYLRLMEGLRRDPKATPSQILQQSD